MKTLFTVLLSFCLTSFAWAQTEGEIGAPKRTPEDLEKLLAPIALYPDALIALILPASTNSSDVVIAARFLANEPGSDVDAQPWEDSIKSLSHYPEVVKWMDENLTWTREVGEAFAAQPADVMNTIQRLRSDARARGLLQDTPQQKVVVRDSEICIDPAQDDVIYVPSYDPEVLIDRGPAYGSWLTFSAGFATGSWLFYDCDWSSRSVWLYRRPNGWNYRPDWRWRDRGDHIRVVHEQWRPNPTYWQHARQTRYYGVRPIPRVEPPHFVNHDTRTFANPRVEGHRDERVSNAPGNWNGRPNVSGDRTWEQRQQNHPNVPAGVTESRESRDARSRGETTNRTWTSNRPNGGSAPIVTAPVAAPDANPTVAAPATRTNEYHRRPEGVATSHPYPQGINNPAPQRSDTPAAVRLQPATSAPERIGQVAPHSSQYVPRQPERPTTYRHEAPAAAPTISAPAPVQHSAPAPAVQHSAPAPTSAPAAAAAPAASPGRDQRGGYQSGRDDGHDRR